MTQKPFYNNNKTESNVKMLCDKFESSERSQMAGFRRSAATMDRKGLYKYVESRSKPKRQRHSPLIVGFCVRTLLFVCAMMHFKISNCLIERERMKIVKCVYFVHANGLRAYIEYFAKIKSIYVYSLHHSSVYFGAFF